jgi:hypothetical protein
VDEFLPPFVGVAEREKVVGVLDAGVREYFGHGDDFGVLNGEKGTIILSLRTDLRAFSSFLLGVSLVKELRE